MRQSSADQQSRVAQMRVEMAAEEAGRVGVSGSAGAMGGAGGSGGSSPISISQAEYDALVNGGRLGTPGYAVARLEQLGINVAPGLGGGIQTFAYRDQAAGLGAPIPIFTSVANAEVAALNQSQSRDGTPFFLDRRSAADVPPLLSSADIWSPILNAVIFDDNYTPISDSTPATTPRQ